MLDVKLVDFSIAYFPIGAMAVQKSGVGELLDEVWGDEDPIQDFVETLLQTLRPSQRLFNHENGNKIRICFSV
jgi:hypothetical protein